MITERELTYFKDRLLSIKQEMTKVIETNQPLSFEDYGELSSLDNHFTDTASLLEDREVQFSLKESAKHILNEVEDALDRMQNGTYGKCVETGKDIPVERLKVLPYAKRIIEAQKGLMQQRIPVPRQNSPFPHRWMIKEAINGFK